jgi:hypothetical protein
MGTLRSDTRRNNVQENTDVNASAVRSKRVVSRVFFPHGCSSSGDNGDKSGGIFRGVAGLEVKNNDQRKKKSNIDMKQNKYSLTFSLPIQPQKYPSPELNGYGGKIDGGALFTKAIRDLVQVEEAAGEVPRIARPARSSCLLGGS